MTGFWQRISLLSHIESVDTGVIDEGMRARINAARVMCVCLMIYVHVPNGLGMAGSPELVSNLRFDHWLESMLVAGPGRSSAALLSIVSGFLIAITLCKPREGLTGQFLRKLYLRRAESILLPMVIWALVTCAVYVALDSDSTSFVAQAEGVLAKLNLVFFLTESPYGATLHLGFLRDLFVCVLLSPLLLFALQRAPKLTIAFLLAVYLIINSGNTVIIHRPLIILCFTIGMWLAINRIQINALDRHWPVFLLLMGVFAVLIIWTHAGMLDPIQNFLAGYGVSLLESVLYPLSRLSGSLALWCMLPLLSGAWLSRIITSVSPYLFAAFCSHFLVLAILFNAIWLPLAGDRNSSLYLIWFLSAPLVSMAVAIAMVNIAGRIHPRIARLMTGGRVQPSSATATTNDTAGGRLVRTD